VIPLRSQVSTSLNWATPRIKSARTPTSAASRFSTTSSIHQGQRRQRRQYCLLRRYHRHCVHRCERSRPSRGIRKFAHDRAPLRSRGAADQGPRSQQHVHPEGLPYRTQKQNLLSIRHLVCERQYSVRAMKATVTIAIRRSLGSLPRPQLRRRQDYEVAMSIPSSASGSVGCTCKPDWLGVHIRSPTIRSETNPATGLPLILSSLSCGLGKLPSDRRISYCHRCLHRQRTEYWRSQTRCRMERRFCF